MNSSFCSHTVASLTGHHTYTTPTAATSSQMLKTRSLESGRMGIHWVTCSRHVTDLAPSRDTPGKSAPYFMDFHLVVVHVSAWYNGWHAGPLLQLGLAVTAWQQTKLWGEPTAHRD